MVLKWPNNRNYQYLIMIIIYHELQWMGSIIMNYQNNNNKKKCLHQNKYEGNN